MIKPEELRTATEKALSGLTADESLKQKILLKASESEQKEHEPVYRPVLKLCAIVGEKVTPSGNRKIDLQ